MAWDPVAPSFATVRARARLSRAVHLKMPEPAGPDAFEIDQATRADGTVVVSVRGELDMATAPELQAVLGDLAAQRRGTLLDLSALQFLDSTGLRLILGATADGAGDGWDFALARDLPTPVDRLFGLAGVRDRLRFES
jgi:anti-anti-sigma factor